MAAVEHALIPMRAAWEDSKRAGLVRGSFEEARRRLYEDLGVSPGPGAGHDPLGVKGRVAAKVLPGLLEAQAKQDAAFLRSLDAIRREAGETMERTRAQKIPAAWRKYRKKVSVVRKKFGSGRANNAARLWLKNGVLRPTFAAGQMRVFLARDFRGIFPYLEVNAVGDERTEKPDAALSGFIAASSWDGWIAEAFPPFHFGCRCWGTPIPWQLAVRFGWSTTFPRGTSKLEAFRRAGGADKSFPRELFSLASI